MNRSIHKIELPHGENLTLGINPILMGILNVTPDSFSDGGLYLTVEAAYNQALKLKAEGAMIIDIGGESTRPGAIEISSERELQRILPVIEAVAKIPDIIISVDTYHAETALAAIKAGAHIINDIKALQQDDRMGQVAAKTGAAVILMHNGWLKPPDGNKDILDEQISYFKYSLQKADTAGIKREKIILDPGFGFGKDKEQNLQLLRKFDSLRGCFAEYPWLVGTSRKRFVKAFSANATIEELDSLTAISTAMLYNKGADIFRVHNVALNVNALELCSQSQTYL